LACNRRDAIVPANDKAIAEINADQIARGRALDPSAAALSAEVESLVAEAIRPRSEPAGALDVALRDVGVVLLSKMRWAWALTLAGYTAHAIAIARGLSEWSYLGAYLIDHPEHAADWLRPGRAPMRRRDVMRGLLELVPPVDTEATADEMLERSALRERARQTAQHISRQFAEIDVFVHQGPQPYGIRSRPDEARGVVRLGGKHDRFAIRVATVFVLPASLVALAAMPGPIFEDSDWNTRVIRLFENTRLWIDRAAAAPVPKWPRQP
jgi:hypothetical protein